jgi:hypothetical protein
MTLTAADYACVFANVVVFCTFQCVFFFFVASRQYDKLLGHKMQILTPYLNRERPGRQLACERLLSVIGNEEDREAAERVRERTEEQNVRTLATHAGPYIALFIVLSAATALRARANGSWKGHHTLACALLVFCFTTEIFYYFGVVRTYQVLGDWELVDRVFEAAQPTIA